MKIGNKKELKSIAEENSGHLRPEFSSAILFSSYLLPIFISI